MNKRERIKFIKEYYEDYFSNWYDPEVGVRPEFGTWTDFRRELDEHLIGCEDHLNSEEGFGELTEGESDLLESVLVRDLKREWVKFIKEKAGLPKYVKKISDVESYFKKYGERTDISKHCPSQGDFRIGLVTFSNNPWLSENEFFYHDEN